MIGLFVLFFDWKMDPPTLQELVCHYTLKCSNDDLGFYYFSKWASKEVQAVTKIKESFGNWKDAYFFMPEANVRGYFAKPSKLLTVSYLRILRMTCRFLV